VFTVDVVVVEDRCFPWFWISIWMWFWFWFWIMRLAAPLKGLADYLYLTLAKWPSGRPATLHKTLVRGGFYFFAETELEVYQVLRMYQDMY
jgi:hypothetical protein